VWNQPPRSLRRRKLVGEIALHDRVAAQHDLAERDPVARHRCAGVRVADLDLRERRHGHTLARHLPRALGERQLRPLRLPGAQRRRPVRLREPVQVRDAKSERLHRLDDRGRRRGTAVATSTV
jgi:hypothetical protein